MAWPRIVECSSADWIKGFRPIWTIPAMSSFVCRVLPDGHGNRSHNRHLFLFLAIAERRVESFIGVEERELGTPKERTTSAMKILVPGRLQSY